MSSFNHGIVVQNELEVVKVTVCTFLCHAFLYEQLKPLAHWQSTSCLLLWDVLVQTDEHIVDGTAIEMARASRTLVSLCPQPFIFKVPTDRL